MLRIHPCEGCLRHKEGRNIQLKKSSYFIEKRITYDPNFTKR